MEYYTRNSRVAALVNKRKSVLLLGPRGTGKSTYVTHFLNSLSEELMTVNFLQTDTFRKYVTSPHILRKEVDYKLKNSASLCVFIDEIQKVPQLLDEIHLLIEKYKKRIVFVLTGSSARKLKSDSINLLAGRAIKISFFTFSFEEIDAKNNLSRVLQYGLLPEAYTEDDKELTIDYLKSYTGTYLQEEIVQESQRRNINKFSSFLELAAASNGTPVNHTKLSRQIGVADQTIKAHYQILEDTLLVRKIPAWTQSIKKQLQKAPKYFFFDNGVINALTGELATELRESSFRYGRLFENFIINEIIKYNEVHNYDYRLYHYRTNHGAEIDLILQKNANSAPVAVEIKSSIMPSRSDVTALSAFLKEHDSAKACVLCRADHPYEENGITFYPFDQGIKQIFN